jgi:hypothetical protein
VNPFRSWKSRLALAATAAAIAVLTRAYWIPRAAASLVCDAGTAQVADGAVLVDNYDPNYLLFERAAVLKGRGAGPVLVPVQSGGLELKTIPSRFVDVMADAARLGRVEKIAVPEMEPITLNVALTLRSYLVQANIRRITVITEGFRSERAMLVYGKVFGTSGIAVSCVPVFGTQSPANWSRTWHGIQEVLEQFIKLQYYRLYVLPFKAPRALAPASIQPSRSARSSPASPLES